MAEEIWGDDEDFEALFSDEAGSDREIATGKKAVQAGLKATVKETREGIAEKVGAVFPEASQLKSDYSDIQGSMKSITDEVQKSSEQTMRLLKQSTERILPRIETYLPKGLYGKIEKFSKDHSEEEYRDTSQDKKIAEDSAIQDKVSKVLGKQLRLDATGIKHRGIETAIDRNLGQVQFETNLSALNKSTTLMGQLVDFSHNEQLSYLRESLILKNQHILIANKTLRTLRLMAQMTESNLINVIKNTGLPDNRKRKLFETAVAEKQEAMVSGALDSIGGFAGKAGKKALNDIIMPVLEGANTVADISNQKIAMSEDEDMFETGPKLSGPAKAISKAGGWLGSKLGIDKLSEGADRYLTETDRDAISNIGPSSLLRLKNLRNRDDWIGGLTGWLDDVNQDKTQLERSDDSLGTASEVELSQTEVIPGLLSRILQSVEGIRTGAEKEDLIKFDYNEHEFVDAPEYKQRITQQIFGAQDKKASGIDTTVSRLRTSTLSLRGDAYGFDDLIPGIRRVIANMVYNEQLLSMKELQKFVETGEADSEYLSKMFDGVDKAQEVGYTIFTSLIGDDGKIDNEAFRAFENALIEEIKKSGYLEKIRSIWNKGRYSDISDFVTTEGTIQQTSIVDALLDSSDNNKSLIEDSIGYKKRFETNKEKRALLQEDTGKAKEYLVDKKKSLTDKFEEWRGTESVSLIEDSIKDQIEQFKQSSKDQFDSTVGSVKDLYNTDKKDEIVKRLEKLKESATSNIDKESLTGTIDQFKQGSKDKFDSTVEAAKKLSSTDVKQYAADKKDKIKTYGKEKLGQVQEEFPIDEAKAYIDDIIADVSEKDEAKALKDKIKKVKQLSKTDITEELNHKHKAIKRKLENEIDDLKDRVGSYVDRKEQSSTTELSDDQKEPSVVELEAPVKSAILDLAANINDKLDSFSMDKSSGFNIDEMPISLEEQWVGIISKGVSAGMGDINFIQTTSEDGTSSIVPMEGGTEKKGILSKGLSGISSGVGTLSKGYFDVTSSAISGAAGMGKSLIEGGSSILGKGMGMLPGLGSGLLDIGKTGISAYGNVFSTGLETIGKVGTSLFSKKGSEDKVATNYINIYREGDIDPGNPLLTKRQQVLGVYFEDGSKLTASDEITEPIYDEDGECLITQEDLDIGLINIDGEPIQKSFMPPISKTKGLLKSGFDKLGKIGSFAKDTLFGSIPQMYSNLFEMGSSAIGTLGNTVSNVFGGTSKKSLEEVVGIRLDKIISLIQKQKVAGDLDQDGIAENSVMDLLKERRQKAQSKKLQSGASPGVVAQAIGAKKSEKVEGGGFLKTVAGEAGGNLLSSGLAKFGLTAAGGALVGGGTAAGAATGGGIIAGATGAASTAAGGLGAAATFLVSNPVGWGILAGIATGAVGYGIYKHVSKPIDVKEANDFIRIMKSQDMVHDGWGPGDWTLTDTGKDAVNNTFSKKELELMLQSDKFGKETKDYVKDAIDKIGNRTKTIASTGAENVRSQAKLNEEKYKKEREEAAIKERKAKIDAQKKVEATVETAAKEAEKKFDGYNLIKFLKQKGFVKNLAGEYILTTEGKAIVGGAFQMKELLALEKVTEWSGESAKYINESIASWEKTRGFGTYSQNRRRKKELRKGDINKETAKLLAEEAAGIVDDNTDPTKVTERIKKTLESNKDIGKATALVTALKHNRLVIDENDGEGLKLTNKGRVFVESYFTKEEISLLITYHNWDEKTEQFISHVMSKYGTSGAQGSRRWKQKHLTGDNKTSKKLRSIRKEVASYVGDRNKTMGVNESQPDIKEGTPIDKLTKQWIKGHEGLRLNEYDDTLGKSTIGYGHLNTEGYDSITPQEAENLFDDDYKKHKEAASKLPEYDNLNPARKAAMIDLNFNMGNKFQQFTKTRQALEDGEYDEAAEELLDSRYARQVGKRSVEVADVINSGDIQDIQPRPIDLDLGSEEYDIATKSDASTSAAPGIEVDIVPSTTGSYDPNQINFTKSDYQDNRDAVIADKVCNTLRDIFGDGSVLTSIAQNTKEAADKETTINVPAPKVLVKSATETGKEVEVDATAVDTSTMGLRESITVTSTPISTLKQPEIHQVLI
ncbi:MAG: glycoside hydrolase family protein [Alphaproteobacteria bacterium]|nr:glycoside hydrolase family protein [Alphaproteobacteria bacterium]